MTPFRCPHCKQPTITAWQKLKSNGWKPSACAACGGKYVPMAWISLVPIALFFVVLYAGLRIAGTLSPAGVVALLVVAPAVSFLAAGAIYLFSPLLRHGSAAARWEPWSFALVVVAVLVYAALQPSPPPTPPQEEQVVIQRGPTAWHISDPQKRKEFKQRLRERNIPFTVEMRDGKEFILVNEERK